jgi:hypothetical protein
MNFPIFQEKKRSCKEKKEAVKNKLDKTAM